MSEIPEHIARWRDRLIERGWMDRAGCSPPQRDRIDYHVVWNGRIYSGRCTLSDYLWSDADKPGHHCYLIGAALPIGVTVRLWRMAPGSD